jgi:hypothetical protein
MDTQTQVAGSTVGAAPKAKAAATVFELPPLPYAENALEPVISAKTLHAESHKPGPATRIQLIRRT